MKKIPTSLENKGTRLDLFLTDQLKDTTRSQIKKLIKSGAVLVNGKNTSVHYFLRENDVVEIEKNSSEKPTEAEVKKPKKKTRAKTNANLFKKIAIIAEEPDFLIIEKPAGLLVHPTDQEEADTLIDWLVAQYPELKKIGEDPTRPALVHRLDKEVSGLMLIPRNQDAFDYFKAQFQERTLTKKYIALVYGEIKADHGEIDFPIGRSNGKQGLFAAKPHSQMTGKERPAKTIFTVLERFKNYTLLDIQILTGRTHQIRVHFLAYGYPIVGDKLYQKRNAKLKPFDRIFLHAAELAFTDPHEQARSYKSALPEKLANFLLDQKKLEA